MTSHRGPVALWVVFTLLLGAVALSIDVPRTTYGIKSDEATYVGAALSLAYDGDLRYERVDLERFEALYHSGPEGIFLKRAKGDHLYFAKAFLYPALAAPFVRAFGLNGLLLLHALLLAAAGLCAYRFLAAQMTPVAAAVMTTAFFGASVLPIYGVFLMPEVLNLALVVGAYFFWLYKEVKPGSRLASPWTDLVAAALLGIGTYSKPAPIPLLVAPLVLLPWIRRQWRWGFVVGATSVACAALLFTINVGVTGEFNYQGGDRKTFYARFPLDAPGATWEARGGAVVTDASTTQDALGSELPTRFVRNAKYFLVGRHFGFVPYFFPAVLALLAWLLSPARRDPWRLLTFGAIMVSAVTLLLWLPWTWSGGGGPPGNRYYSSVYPLFLFLIPPGAGVGVGVVAWVIGALFTAKMVANPFVAAKYTYLMMETGPARWLPVELTMANDLPIRLDPSRGYVHYGPYDDRGMILYFLDQNASPPEPEGMWVSGTGRTDVLVRTTKPVHHLAVEAQSPIRTVLTVSAGGAAVTVHLEPGAPRTVDVPVEGVSGRRDFAFLLSARSSEGFVPHATNPDSPDFRNLGAQLRFSLVR